MMALFRYKRDESMKLNNFLNRLLVEIITSSCLCVGFTGYKNLIIFQIGFLSREIHIIMYIRIVLGFVPTFFYFQV